MMSHPRSIKHHARPPRGFTLIEVLLAAFVLALGVLGLAALFAGGARQQQLATETSRITTLAEAALAVEASLGVMSSLDEDGEGSPTFDRIVDVGRWYALATVTDANDPSLDARFALVKRLRTGAIQSYPETPGGNGPRNFQPFFRKHHDDPVILYQRPRHWTPRLNLLNPLNPSSRFHLEASLTLGTNPVLYNPAFPGSPFTVPPYSVYDASPTTPLKDDNKVLKVLGPAFLPHRALLPESVDLRVSYFEYERVPRSGAAGAAPENFDPFTTPDGIGNNPVNFQFLFGSAEPLGRIVEPPGISRFVWVDPRTLDQADIPIPLRMPANILPAGVRQPNGPTKYPRFPNETVWDPNADTDLYYYAVFIPRAFDYRSLIAGLLPDAGAFADRPSYLVLSLAPDFRQDDLIEPNPTLIAYELAGVLDPEASTDRGPVRSVERIWVERYATRVERLPDARQRIVTVPDNTRDSGRRPVSGYATLYRRTPEGQGEMAIFGYRISPTSRRGEFVPYQIPNGPNNAFEINSTRPGVLLCTRFTVRWDATREQFYVIANEGDANTIIRPGQLILFDNPPDDPATSDDPDISLVSLGADNAVRISARVRVGNQLRGYLDAPPAYRGRPLGSLASSQLTDNTKQSLMGWTIRDRVTSATDSNITPVSQRPVYQLEAIEVRIVPITRR